MLKTFPIALVLAVTAAAAPASGHSWYPFECCHDDDCAPVDEVRAAPELGGVIVTSKVGTALVPATFPKRESRDGRMHVCLRREPGGTMRVLCVFLPPQG